VPVIVSIHPRTRKRLAEFGVSFDEGKIRFLEPFGFFEFIKLEQNALCVLSDSGTVQEECSIFNVPSVTIRDVTERPETIECGSNVLGGADAAEVVESVRTILSCKKQWIPPREYLCENVSRTVLNILMGYLYRPCGVRNKTSLYSTASK
jgi:UDP-N-acetylglucosamine 2-epimerase (non-hydrolysing)